ncbi:MAG: thioredoxin-disulfide reductase [Proteobacteria bacterium]|nr:thioredoxin-disulfide reductase [Pseudomonadota bacterium]
MTTPENLIILGTGAAGLTAAIYATRANLAPLVITGMQPGGQMTITTDVENYPGFADTIQGPWLMQQMQAQAETLGARLIADTITAVDFTRRPFTLTGDSATTYHTHSLIITTGAQARWLGLPSEAKFNGKGVSACATCDGFFYKGKRVAVVGGGNTAVEEALYLANICREVTLIHRRDSLRAEAVLQDRLFAKPNIKVLWNHVIDEVLGDATIGGKGVTGLRLTPTKAGSPNTPPSSDAGNSPTLEVDGVFIAIGHDPATQIFKSALALDADGYILTATASATPAGSADTHFATQTSIEGVFAAGDCVDKIYRQAITAAGMGCMAALDAEKYLAAQPPTK